MKFFDFGNLDIRLDMIQVTGMNKITNRNLHFLRRMIWASILFAMSVFTFRLVATNIEYFFLYPVTVEVTAVSTHRIELPTVSICSRSKYNFLSMQKLWLGAGRRGKMPPNVDLMLLDNYTMDQIWERAGYAQHEMISTCYVGPGTRCAGNGLWKPVFTEYGLCHSFEGASTTLSGGLFGIFMKLNFTKNREDRSYTNSGFMIAIHDKYASVIDAMRNGFKCTIQGGKKGCYSLVTYTMQERFLLNRPKFLCNRTHNYDINTCKQKCVHTFLSSLAKCRFPYMASDEPLCNTTTSVRELQSSIDEYVLRGKFNYDKNCNCLTACYSKFFFWHADTTRRSSSKPVFKVYSDTGISNKVVEKWAYGMGSLTGDIGGVLGLFLGSSILVFVQFVELIIYKTATLVREFYTRKRTQVRVPTLEVTSY